MSIVKHPGEIKSSADLQVWNNAAFDNGYSEDLGASTESWGSLKSIFGNATESLDSVVSGKENLGPPLENRCSSVFPSNHALKPVNRDRATEKSRNKDVPRKVLIEEPAFIKQQGFRDEKKIDEEIEKIESEISRLGSRLEALRLEKAERSVKTVEKRGKVVSAKFLEPEKKKIENISSLSAKSKIQRRGLSLGPAEISEAKRRAMSFGPSEIFGAVKSKQFGRNEMITPQQSRRKSCFFKLQNIDEEKVVSRERGKSMSLSPKSRKLAAKSSTRQAITTIASKKVVKREDLVVNSVQPKKLFGEKSVPANNKKVQRPGRIVASRYSQLPVMRKRSLPENDKDDRCEKKRSLSFDRTDDDDVAERKVLGTESRVKKHWEIPSEIVVHGLKNEKSPVVIVPDFLPRIRVGRRVNETPRDSGPAKKVVDLIGRKSFFDVAAETSVCQTLTFVEDDVDENVVEE